MENPNDTAWVNLQGIKTQDPTNGIYIQNGKKYLVSKSRGNIPKRKCNISKTTYSTMPTMAKA